VSPQLLLAVAVGGALGATGRYLVVSLVGRVIGHGFPWGTLVVNTLGSLAMGLLIGVAAHRLDLTEPARTFLVVGVLGGFTTFSTFSLDLVTLYERHAWGPLVGYVAGSVALGALGLFAGLWITRRMYG